MLVLVVFRFLLREIKVSSKSLQKEGVDFDKVFASKKKKTRIPVTRCAVLDSCRALATCNHNNRFSAP